MKVYQYITAACICAMAAACETTEKTEPEEQIEVTISDISPVIAAAGDTITITGTNFGTVPANVKVYIPTTDNVALVPIKITDTQIKVVVPETAKSGMISLYVADKYYAQFSDKLFEFMAKAQYFSFSPNKARPGEIIEVHGTYDGSAPATVRIKFAGTTEWLEPVQVVSDREVWFRVPEGAATGKVELKSAKQAPGLSESVFTILPGMPPVAQGVWTKRADLPGSNNEGSGKAGAFVFSINNKAYIGGGRTLAPFDTYASSELWEFDAQYNTWMQKADLGAGPRAYAAAFAIGDKGYVGTGLNSDSEPVKDVWEYDPQGNTWAKKADFTGDARHSGVGFSIGNEGYIGTGFAGDKALADLYQYNPATNTWAVRAAIPVARNRAFAFTAGNKAYVGGGSNTEAGGVARKEFYEYDPALDKWTAKTWLPGNYDYPNMNAATSLNGKGYVGLGHRASSAPVSYLGTNLVYEYTPASDTWKALPNFGGTERSGGVAFAAGNAVYFGLGQAHSALRAYNDVWGYMP